MIWDHRKKYRVSLAAEHFPKESFLTIKQLQYMLLATWLDMRLSFIHHTCYIAFLCISAKVLNHVQLHM